MKNLKIDFASLKPYVISAFTEVYGEEYSSIISKKLIIQLLRIIMI